MVDNSAAKSHLNSIEARLNNTTDLNSLSLIIQKTSLDLENVLWAGKNLFIDSDIKSKIDSIVTRLETWIKDELNIQFQSISNLYKSAPSDKKWDTIRNNMNAKWYDLEDKKIAHNDWNPDAFWTTSNYPQLDARVNEYKEIKKYIDWFAWSPTFTPATFDIDVTSPSWEIDVSPWKTDATLPNPTYELCDADGKSIWSWPYKITIWGVEHTLSWIVPADPTATPPRLKYDFSWLSIYPPLTNLPQTIDLSINAICKWVTRGINVIHNKKFKLTLNDWTPKVDTVPARDAAFEDYENSGWSHAISAQLNTKINVRDNDPEIWKNVLERKAIEAALKYKWGTKYDSLTEKQKRLFYERVCRSFAGWPWLFTPVYTWGWIIGIDPDRYNNMKAWFIDGSRPWNNDSNVTWSASAYKTYIHSHLDEKCDEYILTTLQTYLQDNIRNTALKAELSKFLQEIDNNKIDDNQVNWQVHRDLDHRKYRMKRWPWSPFRPRDVNYMRFFSDSTVSLKNQQVNIYTQIDNPEPVNYDMTLNVTWKNSIEVAIKIEGSDEVIKQKSWQPATLVRKIMRDQRIKHGKVRAHIGFNIYKSIIQMAQEKNISLTYRGMEWKMRWNRLHKSRETRKIKLDKNGNIAIKQIDHITTTNTEKDIFVFDQNSFLNVNEFDVGQTNWKLREWLETLWYHFNMAMDALHKQYRKWTERRVVWMLHSRNRMKLPSSFRLSPIKKILNCWTTTNFDFNTSVNSHGTNTKIDFRKNKFTLDTQYKKSDGTMENITVKWRDLWRLLNYRKWRVRIFDGRERDIAEWIYVAMIDALRKNAKVARTNFWVRDNITWNMYVLDEDGQFGVIAREDFKWDNKVKNPMRWPFRRWKQKWSLKKKRLDRTARRPLEPEEQKELMKNPFLMQRFIKAMNRRMWLWESLRSIFVK